MRMALAYAVSDLSLKDVAAWAHGLGVAEITGPGLFYRLRESEAWLEQVLAQTLQDQVKIEVASNLRLRVVDATVVIGPGAKGTEWRAHVLVDPGTGKFRAVELTDAHGGESYGRHRVNAGEVILGDRAYATARGLMAVQSVGAFVLARMNPQTIRLCDTQRNRTSLHEKEAEVPQIGGVEFDVIVPIPPESSSKSHKSWPLSRAIAWVPARAVAARTRRGEVIWLLTTLPAQQAAPCELMQIYRLRWQIGVSSQEHMNQPVQVRPRPTDSSLVAGEAPSRESKTVKPSDNILRKEYVQLTRLQRAVNADVASLHANPEAETVDNARKQQEPSETSPMRRLSPAGYQRRHGGKVDVSTGETLGVRRRNLAEEMSAITVSGKCRHRRQGGGSGRSTVDGRAAKRARREGPGPVSIPLGKVRQG